MEAIKRVLVALDLTEMDEVLMRYIARISNDIDLEKVYFFNVMKSMELPDKIIKKYPDLVAPMDESTKKDIQFTFNKEVRDQLKAPYEIKVTDGHIAEKILKWSKIKEVDMIIMGRKSGLEGDGITSGKVVRLAPCSVIFVPEVLPEDRYHMVVPIDFSPASKQAFEFALYAAGKNPELRITCLNIFEVPSGYHMLGQSYEEFAEIMKNNAKESWEDFIKDYNLKGLKVECKFELNEDTSKAKKIFQFALEQKASSIAVGSKGRTTAAAFLIGSIAEKLIKYNSKIPQIVVKHKNQNMDFLEALFEG